MGNYHDLEYEFVERTLLLISQCEGLLHRFEFKEQYNYTLLINCLTGLIVLPKERTISALPKDRLISRFKEEMGLVNTTINPDITNLKDLIISLRHCVAHFTIEVKSQTDEQLIDDIIFYDNEKGHGYEVARFKASEMLPFIRYYSNYLLHNLKIRPEHKS